MTMRTCGRVVPFGVDIAVGTIMFISTLTSIDSEIAGDAQPLKCVVGFVVEREPRALRHLGAVELDQDFLDAGSVRDHGIGDVLIAERAKALAVSGEIKWNDWDVFTRRVGPDVGFGPMQDRMNAQMRARRRRGVELVPEFRRLVAHVPSALGAARREHPLLGAGRLFVATNAGDQSIKTIFGERKL